MDSGTACVRTLGNADCLEEEGQDFIPDGLVLGQKVLLIGIEETLVDQCFGDVAERSVVFNIVVGGEAVVGVVDEFVEKDHEDHFDDIGPGGVLGHVVAKHFDLGFPLIESCEVAGIGKSLR